MHCTHGLDAASFKLKMIDNNQSVDGVRIVTSKCCNKARPPFISKHNGSRGLLPSIDILIHCENWNWNELSRRSQQKQTK